MVKDRRKQITKTQRTIQNGLRLLWSLLQHIVAVVKIDPAEIIEELYIVKKYKQIKDNIIDLGLNI